MSKETKLRESLDRLIHEQGDPEQVGRVIDKLTGANLSIPDRLWVLKRRLEEMREEAEDLSSLLGYHSGSRLSQVIDHLTEAEELTSETISLTTGQVSSDVFNILDRGEAWEIWDEAVGVGIRFNKGDRDSRSHLRYIRSEENFPSGDEDLIGRTFERLISFSEERFPEEFGQTT